MYTLRNIPPDRRSDARGLTLDEAFVRLMALSERQCMFVRTGWGTQLLMTNAQPSEPIFYVDMIFSVEARQEIKRRVCAHGLGLFQFMTDEEYLRAATDNGAAISIKLRDVGRSWPPSAMSQYSHNRVDSECRFDLRARTGVS